MGGVFMADAVYQVVEKFLENKSLKYQYNGDMVERLFIGCTQNDIKKNKGRKPELSAFAFLSQKSIK